MCNCDLRGCDKFVRSQQVQVSSLPLYWIFRLLSGVSYWAIQKGSVFAQSLCACLYFRNVNWNKRISIKQVNIFHTPSRIGSLQFSLKQPHFFLIKVYEDCLFLVDCNSKSKRKLEALVFN